MGNKEYTQGERVIQFNQATLAQLIPKEDAEAFSIAKATMQSALMDELITKYLDVLDAEEHRRESERTAERTAEDEEYKGEVVAVEEGEELINVNHTPNVTRKKAAIANKSLRRMMRHEILREEVMLDQDHTCPACDKVYPTRREYAVSNPGETYPLVVRCNFPIVEYILKKGNFDPKALAKDEKLFDPKWYTAVCIDCKPVGFKKKHD